MPSELLPQDVEVLKKTIKEYGYTEWAGILERAVVLARQETEKRQIQFASKSNEELLDLFVKQQQKGVCIGSGDDLAYVEAIEEYVSKQKRFWLDYTVFVRQAENARCLKEIDDMLFGNKKCETFAVHALFDLKKCLQENEKNG